MFFRPSFGRAGGARSAQFGEFDFLILSETRLYLGESKWGRSPEKLRDGVLEIRQTQTMRHKVFNFYVQAYAFGEYCSWREFTQKAQAKLLTWLDGIAKPLAPENSLLASNLQAVLKIIRQHYVSEPEIVNVPLCLHRAAPESEIPRDASGGFELVALDYSGDAEGNFVRLEL